MSHLRVPFILTWACIIVRAQCLLLHNRRSYRQTLYNYQNVQYYSDFLIGGQQISGIFDTGSFELLVRSKECQSCAHPTPPYDRSKSTTYKANGLTKKHVFGSGPCVTIMGYESIDVGPMNSPNQAFWEIVDHDMPVLNRAKFAAIVGIGPSFGYGNQDSTLLMSFGVNEFSVCLQKPSGSVGYLTWGPTASPEYVAANFVTAPVLGKYHWGAGMSSVGFVYPGGSTAPVGSPCTSGGCAAIIDSGTSLIAGPAAGLEELSKQIPPVAEDCSNLHTLPPLVFTIAGNTFTIPPEGYVMHITGTEMDLDNIWEYLFFKPKIRKVNICLPAFMQIEMTSKFGPVWILGMPFFRYYHTTFDRSKKSMHFASAGPDCTPLPYTPHLALAANRSSTSSLVPMDVDLKAILPPRLSLSDELTSPLSTTVLTSR